MKDMDREQQVETITTALRGVPMEARELPQFLMMYIMDRDYDRAAICEAEKKIQRERGWK